MAEKRMRTADGEELEYMIDRAHVASVLDALAEICDMKADHVDENWQDRALAKQWRQVSRAIVRAATVASKAGL